MTRTQAALGILAVVGAAGYVALPDAPLCTVNTVFMPCEDARALGSDIACDDGNLVGIVVTSKLMADDGPHEPVAPPASWLPVAPEAISPVECADYSFPSDAADDRVQVVPAAARYPECWVGEVERLATEGEFPTPAEPPHVGVCCAPGCRSAGKAEAIAPGGPKFYECTRLHRLFPDAPCGD